MVPLPKKLTLTILTFGGILAMVHRVPAWRDYKLFDLNSFAQVLDFVDRRPEPVLEAVDQPRPRVSPPQTPRPLVGQANQSIVDPDNDLDRFYRALLMMERRRLGEGRSSDDVVRILHYGDSPTTADLITSDVRTLLQKQFGDAGHGFCLIAKPWAWYMHKGMEIQGQGWVIDAANQSSVKDGLFGLGGVSFRGGAGSTADIAISTRTGGFHQHVEIAYLKQPGGGQLRVEADGNDLGVIRTEAESTGSGFARFDLPPHTRTIRLIAMSGPVRVFGAQLEKDSPGVVYHSLGVNGAYVTMLAKYYSEQHWTEQLQHYQPQLVIVNYGTNESMYPQFVDYASEKETREIIRRLRKALPDASILMMSPMDRGERTSSGEIGTPPAIPRLVGIQERAARESSCAFFNTFSAMGGAGTMGRWYVGEPRLVGADFIHPMPGGAKIVGGLLYQALLDGYNKYKLRILQEKKVVASN